METKNLTDNDYISMGLVNSSTTKKITILSSGAMVLDKDNKQKLQLLVEIDGTQKNFRPNKTFMKVIQAKYGTESSAWVGKSFILSVGKVEGKDAILGVPV